MVLSPSRHTVCLKSKSGNTSFWIAVVAKGLEEQNQYLLVVERKFLGCTQAAINPVSPTLMLRHLVNGEI